MIPTTEKKILEKLNRIEQLLVSVIPSRTELTEDDVLAIVDVGNEEHKRGETTPFDNLIKQKYPHLQQK